MKNPFITTGYVDEEHFCDRVSETKRLTSLLVNGNNVALISPRRMGKTGLLRHCFAQQEIASKYYTFIIDIYATKTLSEFVYAMGKEVLNVLKSMERKVWERFLQIVGSFRGGISIDEFGRPSWGLSIGDIKSPETTLDEIFKYLNEASRPCLVAIDEFQSIARYREDNVEAILRTYIQSSKNAWFVFSGSMRSMMSEMFSSPSRPFYQSTTLMSLAPIPLEAYAEFAERHFEAGGKRISRRLISDVYGRFNGTTWYVQKMCNELFALTGDGEMCDVEHVEPVLHQILVENEESYQETLYRLTTKQKAVLVAISKSEPGIKVTSAQFVKKFNLSSPSSVQKAIAGLVDKELLTCSRGNYSVYDFFFNEWLKQL